MSGYEIKWRGGVAQFSATIGGRRIRKSLGTRDKEAAARKAAAYATRLHRAEEFGEEAVYTFADAALAYMEAGHSERYLGPVIEQIGRRLLRDIKPGHIRELARQLKPNCKNSTLNRHVVTPARTVINYAADLGWCPPIKVKAFPEADVLKQAINREWVDRFRAHASHHELGTLALFMFITAARISEAVAIRPEDLDLAARRVVLPRTKNGHPRVFYLTDELAAEIAKCRAKKATDGTMRVFGYSAPGSPIEAWRNTCQRAGIPYVSRHEGGRHSAATETVVRQGIDPVTAAALLGWKDPRVLLRRYAHAENLGDVAERVFGTKSAQQPEAPTPVGGKPQIKLVA